MGFWPLLVSQYDMQAWNLSNPKIPGGKSTVKAEHDFS